MSNVLLFCETVMINILPKNGNRLDSWEGEIGTQNQIKQSVFT